MGSGVSGLEVGILVLDKLDELEGIFDDCCEGVGVGLGYVGLDVGSVLGVIEGFGETGDKLGVGVGSEGVTRDKVGELVGSRILGDIVGFY